jgi:predicted TIM-barrel fold metal-dependent hydrolase
MDLSFFDCNTFIGAAQKGTWHPAGGRAEMLAAMDAAGIDNALVWHVGQQDWSIAEGNDILSAEIAGESRLWGCWTLLPPHTDEIPAERELFARMKAERIRAARIFPGDHRYVPSRTALGSLLDALVKRRMPLILSLERGGLDYTSIDRLLTEFPRLVCVLSDIGIWGVDRYTRPLLARFPGVHIETSYLALHDGVMGPLVERYGAARFLFGSAFPDRLPASAMLNLVHADIGDTEKKMIAGGNLARLLQEVKL